MRSFKSKLLSTLAWTVPAFTAVLPRDESVTQHSGRPPFVNLELQEDYAQATFAVPCLGCLGHDDKRSDDESLTLTFKTHAAEGSCGPTSNITLNGVYLPQEWDGNFASGAGTFSSVPDLQNNDWLLRHDLDLEWESTCLTDTDNQSEAKDVTKDATQVLTLTIKGIDGKALDKPAGFTISFKQTSPPDLLRLEDSPNYSASNEVNAQAWRDPPTHLRLYQIPASDEAPPRHSNHISLEGHIRELHKLQAQLEALERAIKEKKKLISSQLSDEDRSFKEQIKNCSTVRCVFKVIAAKAHGAWDTITVSIHSGISHSHQAKMGHPDDPQVPVWRPESTTKVDSPPNSHSYETAPLPPRPSSRSSKPPYIIALEITLGILFCGCLIHVIGQKCSSLRTRTERAAQAEERENVQAFRRAARKHAWRNWWRRNWRDQQRIDDYEEKRSLIVHQESILEDAMQEEIRQLRNAHGMVNSLIRAEEGLNSGLNINTQQQNHCAAMGRHIPNCPCHTTYSAAPPSPTSSTYTRDSLADSLSRPLSRSSSLPSYRSDGTTPPAYEDDVDVSDLVANGFRDYTPSSEYTAPTEYTLPSPEHVSSLDNDRRWTPDSSILDVSPRPSAETLRYSEIYEEASDDDKN